MKKYVFMNTTDRAMGNAYKVYDTHSDSYVVILCDYGVMGLNKALQSHGWYTRDITQINNITADSLQRDGIRFIKIHEREQ